MLTVSNFFTEKSCTPTLSNFPAGERNFKANYEVFDHKYGVNDLYVTLNYQGDQDLWDLALLCDAYSLKSDYIHLRIPYLPYARQDRICNEGEPHSLRVVAKFLNSLNFGSIEIWDPHSDVVEALFDPRKIRVLRQWDLADSLLENKTPGFHLISPDAGAEKKTLKLGQLLDAKVFQCSKVRDIKTGEIKKVSLSGEFSELDYDFNGTFVVVDDICDGGRTFTEIAKEVRGNFPDCKMELYVTHGIFSKQLKPFFGLYDTIYCPNVMNESLKDNFEDGVCNVNDYA